LLLINIKYFFKQNIALRGFMTVRGIPDCSRAARIVLKDYVNGKICYCHPPPNVSPVDFQPDIGAMDEPLVRPSCNGSQNVQVSMVDSLNVCYWVCTL